MKPAIKLKRVDHKSPTKKGDYTKSAGIWVTVNERTLIESVVALEVCQVVMPLRSLKIFDKTN